MLNKTYMGIDIQEITSRWCCCFVPMQIGLPEFSNQIPQSGFLVFWAKMLIATTSISASFYSSDIEQQQQQQQHL